MYYKIYIHIYADEETKKKFLLDIIVPKLEKFKEEIVDNFYYICKDWKYGPHFEILLKDIDFRYVKSLIEYYKESIDIYQDKMNYIEMDHEVFKKQAEMLAAFEKISIQNYDKIKQNKSIYFDCINPLIKSGEYSSKEEKKLFVEYNFRIQSLLNEVYLKNKSKSKYQEILDFVPIMVALASCYPKDGIKKGYQSFVSHSEGFFSYDHPQARLYKNKSNLFYLKNKGYLSKSVNQTINEISMKQVPTESVYAKLFKLMNSFIEDVIPIINADKKRENIWISYDKRKKELRSRFKGASEFHDQIIKQTNYEDFLLSTQFNAYRLLVNFIYNQFPYFNFSALDRNLLCYITYKSIENVLNISWRKGKEDVFI